MTKLEPYAAYKSSGIPWIGEVPSQWDLLPSKRVLRFAKEIVGDRHGQFSRLSLTMAGVLPRSKESADGLSPESFSTYQILRPDELVFKMIDLENRKTSRVGISGDIGLVSSAYIVARTTSRFLPKFAYYFFTSLYNEGVYNQLGSGVRSTLNADDLGRIPVPIPSHIEQSSIVSFLDRETAQIDDLIGKQEQLIELLAEKRQAIITHAVSRGLDPTAPTKPSGVPWQGSVPEHWSVQPLKNLMRMQTGVTLGKDFVEDVTETYAYLRVANVQVGYVDLNDVKEIDLPPEVAAASMLQPGDVLMTEGGDRDKLARGCIWDGSISPCVHQNHIFAVRTGPQLLSSFLVLLLDADPARTYFYLTAKQSTNLASTNSTTVKRFRFGLPPISEQRHIVEHLSVKIHQIDALVKKTRGVTTVLSERRSALISAAVTGKIKIQEGDA
ncbi:restriction endonuclease subunit S [Arthrobacter flavus]|uniref:Restriction endonuclease subunit S n=1 Tax=Arthrobacter flavus TaxID=95172 RepID=A0ABW4Q779_9MICC